MTLKEIADGLHISEDALFIIIQQMKFDEYSEDIEYYKEYFFTNEQADAINGYFKFQREKINEGDNKSKENEIWELRKELSKEKESNDVLSENLMLQEVENQFVLNPYDFKAMAELVQQQANFAYGCADGELGCDADEYNICVNEGEILDFIAGLYRWFQYRDNSWREIPYCINMNGDVYTLRHIRTNAKVDLSHDKLTEEEAKAISDALDNGNICDNNCFNFSAKEKDILINILFNILCGKQVEFSNNEEKLLFSVFKKLIGTYFNNIEEENIKSGFDYIRRNKSLLTHSESRLKAQSGLESIKIPDEMKSKVKKNEINRHKNNKFEDSDEVMPF